MTETPDLAAIQARADAATEGPWEAGAGWVYTDPIYPDDNRLANVLGMRFIDEERAAAEVERGQRNAEFIAHARTDVPLLLAALHDVTARAEAAEAAVARALSDHWQTRDTFGGEMRDVCGRCRHGDGAPMLWPCPTRQILTGDAIRSKDVRPGEVFVFGDGKVAVPLDGAALSAAPSGEQ